MPVALEVQAAPEPAAPEPLPAACAAAACAACELRWLHWNLHAAASTLRLAAFYP